jgi:hypothetical protein
VAKRLSMVAVGGSEVGVDVGGSVGNAVAVVVDVAEEKGRAEGVSVGVGFPVPHAASTRSKRLRDSRTIPNWPTRMVGREERRRFVFLMKIS